MVIRSQTKWLLSVYKHNILNLGVDMDFDKYLESAQGSVYVQAGNFHRMVERYASLFGDERIRVVLFEEIIRGVKSVFDDLSDFFNVHIDPGLVHNSSLNQGIDAVTAHILMKMNREAETDPVRKENKRYIQARHNLLQMKKYWEKDFLFSNFKLMNDDRKRWIQDHFKEGNIRLAEMIGKTSSMREYGYLECALDK